jgi:exodeoxyribonuclease V beta subunit
MSDSKSILNKMKDFTIGERWVIQANAGTGKTFTLVNLVAQLVADGKVKAEEILLVTFTIKAAAELRFRVRERLMKFKEQSEYSGRRHLIEAALAVPDGLWNIQTIHSFCQNALLDFSIFSGASPMPRLISEAELVRVAIDHAIRRQWLVDEETSIFRAIRDLKKANVLLNDAAEHLARAWTSGYRVPPPGETLPKGAVARFEGDSLSDDFPSVVVCNTFVFEGLMLLPKAIEHIRAQFGLMTFNTLISDLHRCLTSNTNESKQLLQSIRNKFLICIVDEFQDTDALQWEIFQTVFCHDTPHSFVCVGDPKQSIYGFRGADLATYRRATRWLKNNGAKHLTLSENWRSSPAMIEAVHQILDHEDYTDLAYTHKSISARSHVGIWEDKEKKKPVYPLRVIECPPKAAQSAETNQNSKDKEKVEDKVKAKARRSIPFQIAKEIHELMKTPPWIQLGDDAEPRQLRWSDILILTSGRHFVSNDIITGDQFEVSEALNHFQIPFWVYQRDKLFDIPEVQSILDVMLAALTTDDLMLRNRAFLSPLLSGQTATIWEPKDDENDPRNSEKSRAEIFLTELGILLENKRHNSILILCRGKIASHNSLPLQVKANMELAIERLCEAGILENLNAWQMTQRLHDWMTKGSGADEDDADSESDTRQLQSQGHTRNAVTIMTWHSSKGCEAPVVFVTGGFFHYEGSDFEMRARIGPLIDITPEPQAKPEPKLEFDNNNQTKEQTPALEPEAWDGELKACFGKKYFIGWSNTLLPPTYDENKRLQYVVMTRASVLMYLPYVSGKKSVNRASRWYTANCALGELLKKENSEKIVSIDVTPIDENSTYPPLSEKIERQENHSEHLETSPLKENQLPAVRGIALGSYSSLKKKLGQLKRSSLASESFIAPGISDANESVEEDGIDTESALPEDVIEDFRGKEFGIFVHGLFEDLSWKALKKGPESPEFKSEIDRVIELHLSEIVRRFGENAVEKISSAFMNALTTPLKVEGVISMDGLWQADDVLCEIDFHLPEVFRRQNAHPNQFYTGSIDVVFSHSGRTFFLDWKTDRLTSRELESHSTLEAAMREKRYILQLQLYAKSLFRALHSGQNADTAYESFGGGVYLFIRYGARGVYAHRSTLDELQHPIEFDPEESTDATQTAIRSFEKIPEQVIS